MIHVISSQMWLRIRLRIRDLRQQTLPSPHRSSACLHEQQRARAARERMRMNVKNERPTQSTGRAKYVARYLIDVVLGRHGWLTFRQVCGDCREIYHG